MVDTAGKIVTGTISEADRKKAPQLIIRMKGNYKGTYTVYFEIDPVSLEEAEADDLAVTYNGKKQTPTPTVRMNDRKLRLNKDFRVKEYDEERQNRAAFTGEASKRSAFTLTLTGTGNYTGEKKITLTIGQTEGVQEVAAGKLSVKGVASLAWTREKAESPEGIRQESLQILYKGKPVAEGEYVVDYSNHKAVGTAAVILTGTGVDKNDDGVAFIGTKRVTYKISGTNISKARVEGINPEGYTYTGEEIDLLDKAVDDDIVIKIPGSAKTTEAVLENGTHFDMTYQNNINKGTATIFLDGREEEGYTGTKKVTFKIVADTVVQDRAEKFTVEIVDAAADYTDAGKVKMPFTKGGVRPEVKVTDPKGKELKPQTDYTVSYEKNTKISDTDPKVVVKGKGNYKGTLTLGFAIVAKDVTAGEQRDNVAVIVKDKVYSERSNNWKSSIRVVDWNGKALDAKDADIKGAVYTIASLPMNMEGVDNQEELRQLQQSGTPLTQEVMVPIGTKIKVEVKMKTTEEGGSGNYMGTVSATYRVLEKGHDISKARITILPQTYTGKPIELLDNSCFDLEKTFLNVSKTERVELLLADSDGKEANIEVVPGSYVKNIGKGTAKVTFRGKEGTEYGGTKTVTFKIVEREIKPNFTGIFEGILNLFQGNAGLTGISRE